MVSIKAHFDGQAIIPDEPVDLPRDRSLVVVIHEAEVPDTDATDANGEESVFAWIAKNAFSSPHLPSDLAHQHDHYLYGTPKKPT